MNKDLYVFDIEGDGLLNDITKLHCLCYQKIGDPDIKYTTDYDEMREFFMDPSKIKVGHNIVRFDIPAAEKILDIKVPQAMVIDTLALSWYLFMDMKKHGLEEWGEQFGIKKPEINDWKNLSSEEYIHRCSEDVKINSKLWDKQYRYLNYLYADDQEIFRLCRYFQFKMECIRDQESLGLKLDVEHCKQMLEKLELEKEQKMKELEAAMPKIPVKKIVTKPANIIKKDGTLSVRGEAWSKLINERGLPTTTAEIEVITDYRDPNPNSHTQIKDWLYNLGWKPEHYKYKRDKKTNAVTKIPQIGSKAGGGEVCDSIKKLFPVEPKLELLSGLSILSHRIAMFKGFLADQVDGRIYPSMSGFTNTLRLQHMVFVNLPGIDKKYGKEIRKCFIADDRHILCGSDLSNIEDRTKRHYIYKYDPQYVEEMNIPGYCAHLEIGKLAGMLDDEQIAFYKKYDKEEHKAEKERNPEIKKKYEEIKAIRNKAKIVNFSATYKIGAEALSRNSGNMGISEARKLLDIYWKRNKAIRMVEDECRIKSIGDKKWLYNPISGYWYSLRTEKDKFSTLNQGSAVYVFDIWLTYIRKLGIKVAMQYHDEILFNTKLGMETHTKKIIDKAMEMTNDRLKLNIEVGCNTQFNYDYASCH
jgi:DNA polymerase I-like protein with 3'-5' exonuclease and polymerase domains